MEIRGIREKEKEGKRTKEKRGEGPRGEGGREIAFLDIPFPFLDLPDTVSFIYLAKLFCSLFPYLMPPYLSSFFLASPFILIPFLRNRQTTREEGYYIERQKENWKTRWKDKDKERGG